MVGKTMMKKMKSISSAAKNIGPEKVGDISLPD